MNLATATLNGGFGDTVLILYVIGGLTLAGSAALPNNTAGQRAARIIIGLVIIVWAGYVLLFGGWIIISWYVALLPFILAIQGIVAAVKGRRGTPEPGGPPPLAPGQPAPYPTFGQPAAAAPVPPPGYAAPAQQPYYPAPGQPYPAPSQSYPAPGQPQPPYPAPPQQQYPYPGQPQQAPYGQDPRYRQQ